MTGSGGQAVLRDVARQLDRRGAFLRRHARDPLCPDCAGTGKDIGSDGCDGSDYRDGGNGPCASCEGSGENPGYRDRRDRGQHA